MRSREKYLSPKEYIIATGNEHDNSWVLEAKGHEPMRQKVSVTREPNKKPVTGISLERENAQIFKY